ncbi:MAG: serpin family protein, partial [Oscillospiraceae bacterium]|nr:serpin family protein [Oscillospiraceae bacterium]
YSMMQALSMTANGAKGDTLSEMENVLGGVPIDKLNRYLYTQRTYQPVSDGCKLLTANSIWIRDDADRIQVKAPFLQTNADYYNAAAFMAPFDDTTVRDINTWVDSNTDHMIPKLVDELKKEDVMALINAVTFDAKWNVPYADYQVNDATFTAYDGTKQTAQMLCSEEYVYLQDEHAVGFMKPYQGGRYTFAAILPEEGMTTSKYIQTLTPESLHRLLSEQSGNEVVKTKLPKFSYDYSEELSKQFKAMGMTKAFEFDADFSDMATTASGNLYIGRILQKTHISVDAEGTRAAAVSGVFMGDNGAYIMKEPKTVILDRPFVYCIVDGTTSLPVFIGTLEKLES